MHHQAGPQAAANLSHVRGGPLALERRTPRDNAQTCNLREAVDQFLGQPVADVFVLRVGADIDQRQNRNRMRIRGFNRRGGGQGLAGCGVQIRQHLPHRLVAIGCLLGQSALHHQFERCGNLRLGIAHRVGIDHLHGVQQGHRIRAAEGQPAGEQLIKNHSK